MQGKGARAKGSEEGRREEEKRMQGIGSREKRREEGEMGKKNAKGRGIQ